MALTNAQRQAKHRERQKAKLAAFVPDTGSQEEIARLRAEVEQLHSRLARLSRKPMSRPAAGPVPASMLEVYRSAVGDARRHLNSSQRAETDLNKALAWFASEKVTASDIRSMIAMCGFRRITEFVARQYSATPNSPMPPPDWAKHAQQSRRVLVT